MSVSNVIGTAAAVVGVGVAAAVGYKVFESARTAGALNTAAGDIRAAGGDPGALANLMTALRSTGVLSPGKEGAAVSQGTNEQTQIQTSGVLYAAERTMLAAGSGARLSPNLTVVRPKDVYSNWQIGEGAWLPSQGAVSGFRVEPTSIVRGLDMNAYALVLLEDVYPPSRNPWTLLAVPRSTRTVNTKFREANKNRRYTVPVAVDARTTYDVFVTSTDQGPGGLVALWDKNASRFLTPAECSEVKFVLKYTGSDQMDAPNVFLYGYKLLSSAFLPELYFAMSRHTRFQPFPPSIRGAQMEAQRTAQVQRRSDGTAVR